jgi:sugar lactone lactonase YvrE
MRTGTVLAAALAAGLLAPAGRALSQDRQRPAGELPREKTAGKLEPVATFDGPMPTGVTVSRKGRIFVNFPRWGDPVEFTVAELKDGKPAAFPDEAFNRNEGEARGRFVSVQSVVVDPRDRLWALDTGSINFGPTVPCGPKMVGIDLENNKVFKVIPFPPDVALKTTYLNDVRFDLRHGKAGMAFITDSSDQGPNGLIVVDLDSGKSWRRLNDHPSTKAEKGFLPVVEGRPVMARPEKGKAEHTEIGSDGIAIGHDGKRLFYCPLASRRLYSVSVDALADPDKPEEEVAKTVEDHGDKGGAADGLESDADGRVYLTNYEHNAVTRRGTDGQVEALVHDPRALWPDTLSLAADGHLYFTANQLHRQARFHEGKDLREKPYVLFRVKVDAKPVLLK